MEFAWPTVLTATADLLKFSTWLAWLQAALLRRDGVLPAAHGLGKDAFTAAARLSPR